MSASGWRRKEIDLLLSIFLPLSGRSEELRWGKKRSQKQLLTSFCRIGVALPLPSWTLSKQTPWAEEGPRPHSNQAINKSPSAFHWGEKALLGGTFDSGGGRGKYAVLIESQFPSPRPTLIFLIIQGLSSSWGLVSVINVWSWLEIGVHSGVMGNSCAFLEHWELLGADPGEVGDALGCCQLSGNLALAVWVWDGRLWD